VKRQSNKHLKPRPHASHGTAILGRVIPELVVCGVFNVTDADVQFIAKGINTAILAQYQMELLHASGLLGNDDET
jgi:hypothetical protein